MGKVVQFKHPDRYIWQCSCGSYQFWLYSDGGIRCCLCEEYTDPFDGRFVGLSLTRNNNIVNLDMKQLSFDFGDATGDTTCGSQ